MGHNENGAEKHEYELLSRHPEGAGRGAIRQTLRTRCGSGTRTTLSRWRSTTAASWTLARRWRQLFHGDLEEDEAREDFINGGSEDDEDGMSE